MENPHSNVANCATLEWGTLGFSYGFAAFAVVSNSRLSWGFLGDVVGY